MEPKPEPNPLTPEERLFKIIQESEKPGKGDDTLVASSEPATERGGPGPAAQPDGSGAAVGVQDPGVQMKKARRALSLDAFVDEAWVGGMRRQVLSVRTLNRVLAACLGILALYFLGSQVFRRPPAAEFAKKTGAARPPVLEMSSDLFSTQDVEKQIAEVGRRNIFQPWSEAARAAVAAVSPAAVSSEALSARVASLKLSGIYAEGDSPEALVEDTEEKKTYMVAPGSQFKGLTVKDVKEDSVLLTDGESEYILQ